MVHQGLCNPRLPATGSRCAFQLPSLPKTSAFAKVQNRRVGKVKPCRVTSKDVGVENETAAQSENGAASPNYKDMKDYPYENTEGNGGFFPTRDPGDWPPVEVTAPAAAEEEDEFDPLRDGPLRFLGYANEVGEAFGAWLPFYGVPLSYAIAVAYVFTDTGDKGVKAWKKADKELSQMKDSKKDLDVSKLTTLLATERGVDTVVWQLLASVIIPGTTIHYIVALVHYLLATGLNLDNPDDILPAAATLFAYMATTLNIDVQTVSEFVEKSVPTFCGLLAIPFIVHPIDNTVHAILNVSMRPALRKYLCETGQGRLAGLVMCEEECMLKDFPVLSDENTIVDAFRRSFDEENE